MAKYIVLIRSNLRKAKGQTAAEFDSACSSDDELVADVKPGLQAEF